ncbi:MAG: hypothetical protein KBD66_00345 [Candidatus Doudnabacteria bacterium]|nr:hypothetical protein [Candidatus Doudnabacteria bacterium]
MQSALEQIFGFYARFLDFFPESLRPYVSILVGVCIVVAIFQVIRREFVWLIVLVVLLPASVPILKELLTVLLQFLRYLFGMDNTTT